MYARVLQDGDDRALRENQPGARQLGREHLLSREEVRRLQGLRGNYGIKSPAPICADGSAPPIGRDPAVCQIVEAPASRGARLIPTDPADLDGEIRLSYRELTALIEDAVKALLGGQHG